MPTIVDCPACSRKLRVADDLIGHLVRCPTCGDTFTISATAGNAPAVETSHLEPVPSPGLQAEHKAIEPGGNELESSSEAVRGPGRKSVRKSIACPRCGETVSATAARCRFCGERLLEDEDERDEDDDAPTHHRRVRRDWEPHRGTIVLVLGILSIVIGVIGLFLGIAAWVMGSTDLKKMKRGEMDPEGRGVTQAGWICGIIGTIWQGVMSLICIGYIVFIGFFITAASQGKFGPTNRGPAPIMTPKAPKNIKDGLKPTPFDKKMDRDDDDDEDR